MKNPVLHTIRQTIWHDKGFFVITIVMTIGAVFVALWPALVLEGIVDELTLFHEIAWKKAVVYFALTALAGILESQQNVMITILGQKLIRDMRKAMCRKLSALPAAYFTNHETGKVTARFVNDVDALDALFTNGIIAMFADACKVSSIYFVICMKSQGLGLLLLFVLPFIFAMTRIFQKGMLKAQMLNRKALAQVNNHVPESMRNIRSIHVLGIETYMEKKYEKDIEESYHACERSNWYDSLYSPVIILISAGVISVMMVQASLGETMQQYFGITVGGAVAMIAYVGKIFDPLENIGMEIQNIQSAVAGVKRINEFLKEKEVAAGTEETVHTAEISFEQVCFSYDGEEQILQEVTKYIAEGENVVVSGRTGAGKSTLFRLLLGLYQPQRGHVRVGGIDAAAYAPKARRALFGYVQQQFMPVAGCVYDQITLFDEKIGKEQVYDVMKQVGLHDKILSFSQGYDTDITQADFSQGEYQLLSIARALIGNPKIMLLDEMTANLDSESERKILTLLTESTKNRTVLSISHRLQEQKAIQVNQQWSL